MTKENDVILQWSKQSDKENVSRKELVTYFTAYYPLSMANPYFLTYIFASAHAQSLSLVFLCLTIATFFNSHRSLLFTLAQSIAPQRSACLLHCQAHSLSSQFFHSLVGPWKSPDMCSRCLTRLLGNVKIVVTINTPLPMPH